MFAPKWFSPDHKFFPAILFLALTLVFLYPTIFQLSSHLIGGADDAWICPWNAFQFREKILKGQDPYYTDLIFAPVGTSLLLNANTEFNSVVGLLVSPWVNEVGQANLSILLATFLSALGIYLLAYDLTQHRMGSIFAGIGFAFCPFRILRMAGHTNFATSQWLPLSLWSFLRMAKTGEIKYALITGAFFALNYYSNQYYTVFLTLAFFIILVYGLWQFPEWRTLKFLRNLCVSGVIAIILLLPVAYRFYLDSKEGIDYTFQPGKTLAERTAAQIEDFFRPGPYNPIVESLVPNTWGAHGKFTSGWVITALGIIGIVYAFRLKQKSVLLFGVMGFVFLLFSLGPYMDIAGYKIPTPYYLLRDTPLVNHVRIPSRFAVMVSLSLALIAAFTISRLTQRKVLVWVLLAVLCFELFPAPMPMEAFNPPPILFKMREMRDGTVLTMPLYLGNAFASRPMTYQLAHRKKLIAGRTARGGPWEVEQYYENLPISSYFLRATAHGPTEGPLLRDSELGALFRRFFDVRYLLIHPPHNKNPLFGEYLSTVFPDARLLSSEGNINVYELPDVPLQEMKFKAGQPGIRFFLFLHWERDAAQPVYISRKNSPKLLLPVIKKEQRIALELRLRSSYQPFLDRGKIQFKLGDQVIYETNLTNKYQMVNVVVPGKELLKAHQVLDLDLLIHDDSGESTAPRLELQSVGAQIL